MNRLQLLREMHTSAKTPYGRCRTLIPYENYTFREGYEAAKSYYLNAVNDKWRAKSKYEEEAHEGDIVYARILALAFRYFMYHGEPIANCPRWPILGGDSQMVKVYKLNKFADELEKLSGPLEFNKEDASKIIIA